MTLQAAIDRGDQQKRSPEGTVSLDDRKTGELVLAFVGPVGSGVTTTVKTFEELLVSRYQYRAEYIRVSDIIAESASVVGETFDHNTAGDQRIARLQAIGSKLRQAFSDRYLAEKCIERIATSRLSSDGYDKRGETLVSLPRRHVHLIDSLKNPAEVEALKEVYGETVWLIGVFAPEEIRKQRLRILGHNELGVHEISSVDEEEGVRHGQRVRDTMHLSDFFIRNDGENTERLEKTVDRYLDILFNLTVSTPSQDEIAMYTAASAASRSACLSRQVGAAIYSASGELIGVGANDVPKKGGGLYCLEDSDKDHRCYKWGGKICHNDDYKDKLYGSVIKALREAGALSKGVSAAAATELLKSTEIRSLIEYSRAVHAEMEAIISVARSEKAGLVGATMYSTTFPCHSCARHIVASGIARVIYIEPYTKSLATTLHRDAISVRETDQSKVVFLQYEGVAPRNMERLFKHGVPRKKNGKLIERDPRTALPVFPAPLDGFTAREQIVVKRIAEMEAAAQRRRGTGDAEEQHDSTQLQLDVVPPTTPSAS